MRKLAGPGKANGYVPMSHKTRSERFQKRTGRSVLQCERIVGKRCILTLRAGGAIRVMQCAETACQTLSRPPVDVDVTRRASWPDLSGGEVRARAFIGNRRANRSATRKVPMGDSPTFPAIPHFGAVPGAQVH
jgi:hypothetical protein